MPDNTSSFAGLVTRNKRQSFMNTGTVNAPAWSLIGEGFTSLAESKNPNEYSRHYVHEATERTDVTGYAPSIAYALDVYSDDPCIQKIIEITDKEEVGAAAQVDVVNVNLFEPVANATDTYKAYKRTYAVVPGNVGEGTDALNYTGTFKAVGDAAPGQFAIANGAGTFTADT